jgi:5-hydroxyisourate hydrolase
MSLSTHVLDATSGSPAAGLAASLWESAAVEGESPAEGAWTLVAEARTDADGRIKGWMVHQGIYRLVFATGPWWAERGSTAFHPEVVVTFTVVDPGVHHHVPLLLSPYAYTTYRGT